MNRAGWNPFRELEEMSDRLNRVVARVPQGSNGNEAMTTADWTPPVDISETTSEYVIKVEIPEVKNSVRPEGPWVSDLPFPATWPKV